MPFASHELGFDLGPDAGANWSDVMRRHHGLHCRFDGRASAHSVARGWKLGDMGVTRAALNALAFSPVSEGQDAWQGEWLFLKLVTEGYVEIELDGQARRFDAGSMFALDPRQSFTESFPEHGAMTILRIPKLNLRERGLPDALDGFLVADMASPDMLASRALIECISRQHDAPSHAVQRRLGEQLFDLIDIILAAPAAMPSRRSAQAVLFRAKTYIGKHLGDEDLGVEAVAASVHVSPKHLQRLFRAEGLSVIRVVWDMRLEQAERLLRDADPRAVAVQDVAWQCGFRTAAHFSRAFSARYGLSPRELRAAGGGLGDEPRVLRH
jgi:AraC-like DNA-binding protein